VVVVVAVVVVVVVVVVVGVDVVVVVYCFSQQSAFNWCSGPIQLATPQIRPSAH